MSALDKKKESYDRLQSIADEGKNIFKCRYKIVSKIEKKPIPYDV